MNITNGESSAHFRTVSPQRLSDGSLSKSHHNLQGEGHMWPTQGVALAILLSSCCNVLATIGWPLGCGSYCTHWLWAGQFLCHMLYLGNYHEKWVFSSKCYSIEPCPLNIYQISVARHCKESWAKSFWRQVYQMGHWKTWGCSFQFHVPSLQNFHYIEFVAIVAIQLRSIMLLRSLPKDWERRQRVGRSLQVVSEDGP